MVAIEITTGKHLYGNYGGKQVAAYAHVLQHGICSQAFQKAAEILVNAKT